MSLNISPGAFPPVSVTNTQSHGSLGSALLQGVQTLAPDTISRLVDRGEDLSATDSHGNTLLHLALRREDSCAHLVLADLLRGGLDVNAKNLSGNTPLMSAIISRDWDSALVFLQQPEIDVYQVDHQGNTALHLIPVGKPFNRYVVASLVEQGLNIDQVNDAGKSPLHCAIEHPDIEKAQYLIELGANINLPDHNGTTPFYMMIDDCLSTLVQFTLSNGADPNLPYPDQSYPIQHAVRALKSSYGEFDPRNTDPNKEHNPKAQIVWDLVQANADLSVRDEKGNTPLHLCGKTSKGKGFIWHLMREKGADPHALNNAGKPPVFAYDHVMINSFVIAFGIMSCVTGPLFLGALAIKCVQVASERLGRGNKLAERSTKRQFKDWSSSRAP